MTEKFSKRLVQALQLCFRVVGIGTIVAMIVIPRVAKQPTERPCPLPVVVAIAAGKTYTVTNNTGHDITIVIPPENGVESAPVAAVKKGGL